MFSVGFSRFSIVLGFESIVVVFVMLFRAHTNFSQNGDRPKFSFVLMLITSLTSLTHLFIFVSNMAAMTSVDKSFNPAQIAWNKRNKTHNTIPRQWSLFCVVLLYQEGFAIVPAIDSTNFVLFWTQFKLLSKWLTTDYSFVLMLIKSRFFVLAQQHGRHDVTRLALFRYRFCKTKGSKVIKNSKIKRQTKARTIVSLLCLCIEFALSFHCFYVGLFCSVLCDSTLGLMKALS